MNKIILYLVIFIYSQFSFSQSKSNNNEFFFEYIKALEFNKAEKLIPRDTPKLFFQLQKIFLNIIEDDGFSDLKSLFTKLPSKDKLNTDEEYFLHSLILGYKFLKVVKNKPQSFKCFIDAYEYSKKLNLQKEALFHILKFYSNSKLLANDQYKEYLNKYKNKCQTNIDLLYYFSFEYRLSGLTKIYNDDRLMKNKDNEIILFNNYDSLMNQINELDIKAKAIYYIDKANYLINEKPLEAMKNFKTAIQIAKNKKYGYFKRIQFTAICGLSRVSNLLNQYQSGLIYINRAKKYVSFSNQLYDLYALDYYKSNHFYHLKQYDSAYHYLKKVNRLQFKLNFQKENQEVAELRTKLNTEKTEKENLQLANKIKINKTLTIVTISMLLLISFIGILLLKNTKRKQKLAEQDKEIQTQKLAVVLKEQELTAIDAMIEGQEKERQRIANDLHDDLGGLMANIKMHFSALKKEKEPEELFDKTNTLIDEAYQKIRSVAHVKNAGVIANQGLLKSINHLANSVSSANKIKIEVVDHGLDNRLENSLELTLFRIIQELITNIIKHSEATEATIHLTNHEDSLNIVVEDNGKGFNPQQVNHSKSGMGINSIDKRISNLDGQFFIDSDIGHGTTIIIDIPY